MMIPQNREIRTMEDLREAIEALVLYNLADELHDYRCQLGEGETHSTLRDHHIYVVINALNNWINNTHYTVEEITEEE